MVFSENTNILRLGLLDHVLDLCESSVCIASSLFGSIRCCYSLSYLDAVCFKKQQTGRSDYSIHSYMELCQFIFCLLSRSRKVSSLPDSNSWETYMDVSKIAFFDSVSSADVLRNYDFGSTVRQFKGGEGPDFLERCREFFDRLVQLILAQHCVSADFMCGLYCLWPELLLEGDDKHVFDLFRKLVRVLERNSAVSDVESSCAVEEFLTYVVDAPFRHVKSNQSAEEVEDVVAHLLTDYSFLARKNLCRVFKVCCLVAVKLRGSFFAVEIDLSGCKILKLTVLSCIRGVQSCVLSAKYKQKSFFTKHTMDRVRDAVSSARIFMSLSSFNPWERICGDGQGVFVSRYMKQFNDYVALQKGDSYERLRSANKRDRKLQSAGGDCSTLSCSGSASSSVVGTPVSGVE